MVLSDFTRKQAFFTHLAFSSSIFIVLSYLIIFHWYPDFYFWLDGGIRAIATVFFVDVVLGPGLTLLVFKPGKKSLKFDMTVILVVQFMALSWGIYKVYTERPATSVYYQGKFTCISYPDAGNINMQPIIEGLSGKQHLSFLQRPDTVDDVLDFTKEAFAHKSSAVYYYGEKLVPLDKSVRHRLDKYELDMDLLRQNWPDFAMTVEHYMRSDKFDAGRHKLTPLQCRYEKPLAVLDVEQMRIVDWFDSPGYLLTRALDEPLPLRQQLEQSQVYESMKRELERVSE